MEATRTGTLIAAIILAAGLSAQAPIWDIKPLPTDSVGLCLTYMRGFGQYTHPTIGNFEVGVFKDSNGNFWTVRLAPGFRPKEGEEVKVTGNTLTL